MRNPKGSVLRHTGLTRLTHWAVALSTFGLIFTGLGQLPVYRRYNLIKLPGLAWADQYPITLALHYLFAAVLLAALTFHVVRHLLDHEWDLVPRRGDAAAALRNYAAHFSSKHAPVPGEKFLPEQRLAYAYMAVSLILVVITGLVKVYKNLPGVVLPQAWITAATTLHNVATVMIVVGIVAHLGALCAFRENRTMIPSIFHGRVPLAYARERHSLWISAEERGTSERRAG